MSGTNQPLQLRALEQVPPESTMEFTGERFTPGSAGGDISLEHWHRYAIAATLIEGKDVLDLASGEGYGTAYLARRARSAVGVDVSEEAVVFAQNKYVAENLRYLMGDCAALPLADGSVDAVVSFETLEHVRDQEGLLREVKRVLRPGGVFIVSSPDKANYSDAPGYQNPFHVSELYRAELERLIARFFKQSCLLGQRIVRGSLVARERGPRSAGLAGPFAAWEETPSGPAPCSWSDAAVYHVVIASDGPLPVVEHSLLEPSAGTPLRDERLTALQRELELRDKRLTALETELELRQRQQTSLQRDLGLRDEHIAVLSGQVELRDQDAAALRRELASSEQCLAELRSGLEARDQEIARLRQELALREERIAVVSSNIELRDQDVAALRRDLASSEERVAVLSGNIELRDQDIAALRRDLTLADERFRALQQDVTFCNERIAEQIEELADRAERAATLARENEELAKRISALEDMLDTASQRLLQLHCGLDAAAQAEEARVAGQLRSATARLHALEIELATRRGQLAARQRADNPTSKPLRFRGLLAELVPAKASTARKRLERLRGLAAGGIIQLRNAVASTASSIRPSQRAFGEELEILRASGLFDADYYLGVNQDVADGGIDPLLHYLRYGAGEGRDPNPFFSTSFYLQQNPSVAAAGVNPLLHYVQHGAGEGRDPSPLFDTSFYLESNPDVRHSGINPLRHFREYGLREGRLPKALDSAPLDEPSVHPLSIEAVRASGLFDAAFYVERYPDVALSGVEPVVHYVRYGASEGRDPNAFFSTSYYLGQHPDVAIAGVNPLLHFVLRGAAVGMDPSPLFDTAFYLASNPDVRATGVNPLLHYLESGRAEGRAPVPSARSRRSHAESGPRANEEEILRASGLFDQDFYLAGNPDVAAAGVDPLLHYLERGAQEGRDPNPFFATTFYLEKNRDALPAKVNPLVHFVTQGAADGLDPSPLFDTSFYLRANPDVAKARINPLRHFIEAGREEGRLALPPVIPCIGDAGALDPAKETVLVVSHEASRSGAPILSLNIGRHLRKRYNVITLLLGDGSLVGEFVKAGDLVLGPVPHGRNQEFAAAAIERVTSLGRLKFAIVNSIEARAVLKGLAERFVPSVLLIHEFASYTRPKTAIPEAAGWASEVVFSAELVRENALSEFPTLAERRSIVLPQGRCTVPTTTDAPVFGKTERARISRAFRPEGWSPDTVVIMGAGFVHIRKGVDLFIACAAKMAALGYGKRCRFVWVGSGYAPDHDTSYSVYLADQVRRAGLEDQVAFVDEITQMEFAYEQASVLLMSSRLDPLPNVAIDAMSCGLPVVCFDKATGIAETLVNCGLGDACVAPYLDVEAMTDKVRRFVDSSEHRLAVGRRLKEFARGRFDMGAYVERLESLGRAADEQVRQEQADCDHIISSRVIRRDFLVCNELMPLREAVRRYVRAWSSTVMARRKPFPGFHPGIFDEQAGATGVEDPLVRYLKMGAPSGPWRSQVIAPTERELTTPPGRVGLHVHAHYPDVAEEILERLALNEISPDLFISVSSKGGLRQMQSLTSSYRGVVADIQIAPNRGRDIGPFLTLFGRRLMEGYSLIGHVHTKRSLALDEPALGRQWLHFLLENLLGGAHRMADRILSTMADDPEIGLVFADDPNVVGWSSDLAGARALGERLGLTRFPTHFNFPVGTMFWARPEAIRPLVELGLQWEDYPPEPLPYDGTLLHAIERLFPFVSERAGFRCALTNVPDVTR